MRIPIVHDKQEVSHNITRILWLAFTLLLIWPAIMMVLGSTTLIPVDNLFQYAPYRAAAQEFGVSQPHIPLYTDLILQNYPWWQFILQSLQDGQLPLWNPYIFSGTPFLAKGQHMALYPLSLPFYLFPLEHAYGIFIVIHFVLAICTTAFFANTLGISRYGSLLSGLIFGISGFMLARVVFPMIIAAAAWLPLVLTMAERTIVHYPHRGQPRILLWALLGALGLGFQSLVGHPEIVIYTLLTLFFYCIYRILTHKQLHHESYPPSKLCITISSLVILVLLGLLIGAVQLLPQYLILQENFRGEAATFSQIIAWAYPWKHAITSLVPNFFGNPAQYQIIDFFSGITKTMSQPINWGTKNFVEGAMYIGIFPLLLVFSLILQPQSNHTDNRCSPRQPSSFLFSLLLFLSLSFVFGTPLYYMIFILPGMEQVHSPFRWIIISILSMAILSGYGIDRLKNNPRHAIFLSRFSVILGSIILGCIVFLRLFFTLFEALLENLFHTSYGAVTVFNNMQTFYSFEAPWFLQLASILIISGVVLHMVAKACINNTSQLATHLWQPLVAIIIAGDLLLFARGLYADADPALLHHTPKIVTAMKQDTTQWRFSTFDPQGTKFFPANAGWLYNIEDIRGYDSIFSASYRNYMESIGIQDELEYNRISPLRNAEALNSPLLDLLNVKYILSEIPVVNPRYTLAAQNEGLILYRNTEALPRAFTLSLPATIISENPFDAMLRYDPRNYMILSAKDVKQKKTSPPTLSKPLPARPGSAEVKLYQNNEVILSVHAKEPLWLVLTDSYDIGWKAAGWTAENPSQIFDLPIHRAYGALRAVSLSAGDWTVRFSYRPVEMIVGLLFTLAAVFICGLGILFSYRSNKDQQC